MASVAERASNMGVFLVDEHPLFRTGLRLRLEEAHDMEPVGEAATGEDALRQLRRGNGPNPDVILVDLSPSDISETEFIQAIEKASPGRPTRVLVVSAAESDEAVIRAMSAGAHGFMGKTAPWEELMPAIRLVAGGGVAFGSPLAARMETIFSAVRRIPGHSVFPQLTTREAEVLDLLARGYGNRAIARALYVAEKTVRNHVTHIFAKLQVHDRETAAAQARKAGMGAEPRHSASLKTCGSVRNDPPTNRGRG
ncbi:response regulator transcription factor [Streptomyces chartreusis]|uniref:response regulator transcription factor n=1 Tax=Streptomyces chartreusis TaxID=1969 RepID=UPI0033A61450